MLLWYECRANVAALLYNSLFYMLLHLDKNTICLYNQINLPLSPALFPQYNSNYWDNLKCFAYKICVIWSVIWGKKFNLIFMSVTSLDRWIVGGKNWIKSITKIYILCLYVTIKSDRPIDKNLLMLGVSGYFHSSAQVVIKRANFF